MPAGISPATRRPQQQRKQHDHDALAEAEIQERRLVAEIRDRLLDRDDGQRGTGPEPGSCQPGAQAAPVGKPFQCVADAGPVHGAGAGAADRRGDIEHGQRVRDRVQHPRYPDQDAAEHHHDLRPEPVHEPTLDRHEPGLGQHENAEGHLNGGAPPMMFIVDRQYEQRPAILQVGNHHHADDAEQQLQPAICRRAADARNLAHVLPAVLCSTLCATWLIPVAPVTTRMCIIPPTPMRPLLRYERFRPR